MAIDRKKLQAAYAYLLKEGASAAKREQISTLTGLSTKTLADYIREPKRFFGAQERSKKAIVDWYNKYSFVPTPYTRLSKAVMECLQHDDTEARRYEGRYVSFRKAIEKRKYVKGNIEIAFCNEDGCWMHYHTSTQATDGRSLEFSHAGPIAVIGNRVYLIGIGNMKGSRYVRVMIMRNVDDPISMPITGMLLTERYKGNVPMASKVVMYHESICQGAPDDEELENTLKNDSSVPDIIYGWSEDVAYF